MKQLNTIPKIGDHGQDVLKLQVALSTYGFKVTTDGVFGSKTKQAVSLFQLSKKLGGSGILGPKTIKFLGLEVVAVSPVTGQVTITKDLKGKQGRHVHPSLRIMAESHLFPNGNIPRCFVERDLKACVIATAEAFEKIEIIEVGGDNMGPLVGQVQSVVGAFSPNGNGDHWCMSGDQNVIGIIEDFFGVESPIIASEHCVTVFNAAKKVKGLIAEELIEVGGFFIGQYVPKTSGHTGANKKKKSAKIIVTSEANTGSNSVNNGDRWKECERDITKIKPLKLLGTIRVYPNNIIPAAG